ncbi:MAG: methionine adenosyltransferase [Deltaproteobacteria bacterium]|nr:methionine adenosyltransferase [Deltaproteobacteria bacterium]NIS78558.1 methionine adenosyltransferase [Deltaproteobacteria bacterium]
MIERPYLFTSESVTEGHPDKVADQISDAILDDIIRKDADARVACEALITAGLVMLGGEVTTGADCDVVRIVKDTIKGIGYVTPETGFDADSCGVVVALNRQSPDIAMGVDRGAPEEQGAGDQGMMFGFACDETPELMPLPIMIAHKISKRLARCRKEGILPFIWPDGKCQVTVQYDEGKPVEVVTVVVSSQHTPEVSDADLKDGILEEVVKKVVPPEFITYRTNFLVNPTGRFVAGGPMADTGLTGRKIIVDTYGGSSRHGGGAFSGKDPSKVDRSASYMARYIAKNIIGAGVARKCEIQIAYAIGVPEPVSVNLDFFNTGVIPEKEVEEVIPDIFDMRPGMITKKLDLLRPIYLKTAAYGHFGREDEGFPWENRDGVSALKDLLRLGV